jgi:hypothetical protein
MKAAFERDGVSYVTYDNTEDANILHENFYLVKRLFGIPVYRKRFRQSSNLWDKKKKRKGVGF